MSPHQTFLGVLVGQGLVGLMLFTGMIVTAFWSIHRMRGLQQKFWIVMAPTLISGLLPRTWDTQKPTWILLALVAAQAAASRVKARPVPSEQAVIVNGFTSSPTVRRRVPL